MDTQIIHDLVMGVASNGLWAIVAATGTKSIDMLRARISSTPSLDFYTSAAESIYEQFPSKDGSARSKLRQYLGSPDVEALVRQIYASTLLSSGEIKHLPAIEEEFLRSFALYLDVSFEQARTAGSSIFEALVRECDRQLAVAIEANALPAHEAKSAGRHRQLLGEIANIERALAVLTRGNRENPEAILQFEEKYRNQVGSRHAFIQPPQIETARKFPIDELYVTPTFISGPVSKQRAHFRMTLAAFLGRSYRTILLGNPGGGKSTLALKVCHDLATRHAERILGQRLVTPVLVVLREYGAQKKTDHCSILQFIESQSASRYQVSPTPEAFEYLLVMGRLMVIFDGLDELLDTSYRQEISGDVESFCNLYPTVPVIVTSREVGYDQAPLDPKQFWLLKIASFEEEQVDDYATKWFARDEDLTAEQQQSKAKAFVTESSVAKDLRSNPLMLGLMCNLYRVDGYIPKNRPEIYEKCSLMLFERWDKGRGIIVSLPFEEHIRPAMQHLAFWIYSQEELQGGVTENKLIDETAKYLNTWVFEDIIKARAASQRFIEFCTGRAWVFTDTGTTAEGEKLYQFTHRTFLEYFAAVYLFSIYPTPELLASVLTPRISKQEWDVVALLAYQIQSRRVQGAGDRLLEDLVKEAQNASRNTRMNLLLFAARCLQSIVPSPPVRRTVSTACIEECLAPRVGGPIRARADGAMAILAALHATSPENLSTVGEAVENRLCTELKSGKERASMNAYDIAYHLPQPMFYGRFNTTISKPVDQEYWTTISKRILLGSEDRLRQLARKDLYLASTAYDHKDISIQDVLSWHGTGGVFTAPRSRIFLIWKPSLATRLFLRLFRKNKTDAIDAIVKDLSELGSFLVSIEPPWVHDLSEHVHGPGFPVFFGDISHWDTLEHAQAATAKPEVLFAAFSTIAVFWESASESGRQALAQSADRIASPIRLPLLARLNHDERQWNPSGIPDPFKAVMSAWVRENVSFTRAVPTIESQDESSLQIDLILDDAESSEELGIPS